MRLYGATVADARFVFTAGRRTRLDRTFVVHLGDGGGTIGVRRGVFTGRRRPGSIGNGRY